MDCIRVIQHLNSLGLTPEFCDELHNMVKQPPKLPQKAEILEFDALLKMMKMGPNFKEFKTAEQVGEEIDKMMEGVPSLQKGIPSKRYSMAGMRSKP